MISAKKLTYDYAPA